MAAPPAALYVPGGPRTYASALALLDRLPSNKSVTSLFSVAPAAGAASAPQDLNSLAIPEMVAWLGRAGYAPDDLARSLRCVHVAGTKGKGSVAAMVTAILSRPEYRDVVSGRGAAPAATVPESGGKPVPAPSLVDATLDDGPVPGVGLYTSPHLVSPRERISLSGGVPISQAEFARLFFEVWDRLSAAARAESSEAVSMPPDAAADGGPDGPFTKPFYFRFLTLMALHYFMSSPPARTNDGFRSAVVECGIGGEYDATNVLPAEAVTVAVVTALGFDHVAMLGGSRRSIAWHKAGIFKRGGHAVALRPRDRELAEVLLGRAAEKGVAGLELVDEEWIARWKGIRGSGGAGFWPPAAPDFEKTNMALAAAAARRHLTVLGWEFDGAFGREGYELDEMPAPFVDGLRSALNVNTKLRGRAETLVETETGRAGEIVWHVDGAHTTESLAQVGRWFARSKAASAGGAPGGELAVLVFNQQDQNRDASGLLAELLRSIRATDSESGVSDDKIFHLAVFTRNEQSATKESEEERDLAVQRKTAEAMKELSIDTQVVVADNVEGTLERVRSLANEFASQVTRTRVLVTGSLYLVGAVLRDLDSTLED